MEDMVGGIVAHTEVRIGVRIVVHIGARMPEGGMGVGSCFVLLVRNTLALNLHFVFRNPGHWQPSRVSQCR